MNNKPKKSTEAIRIGVSGLCLVLGGAGCSTASSSHSTAASTAHPSFVITLHCAPEDEFIEEAVEFSNGMEESQVELAAVDIGPVALPSDDYECFTLLEAMQNGAERLADQARFERTFAR